MKRGIILIPFILLYFGLVSSSYAQYRNQPTKPNMAAILSNPGGAFLGGFLNPEKLQMRHTVSMSYGSLYGQGLMLSSYMNTIDYQFSDKLWMRANLGIVSSPYNTFGEGFYLNKPQFFGGAELQYQISKNTKLTLQIQSSPFGYSPVFGQFSEFYR